MPILYLARHGETADNARSVFQGQGGSGLNRLGRAQAARLAERMRGAPPDAIVTSDLERAVETARIVAEACRLPFTELRGLREVDVGTWTGRAFSEIAAAHPEEWAAWNRGLDVRRGGGETYEELADRVDRALEEVVGTFASRRRILVVSHGGAIKSWVAKLLRLDARARLALSPAANAGLTVVERAAEGGTSAYRLHSWNDTAHLDGLIAAEHRD